MDDYTLIMRLTNLLVEQQALSKVPSPDQRICADLGVCGGDFQNYMSAVWAELGLPSAGQVAFKVSEAAITLADVAALVREHERSPN